MNLLLLGVIKKYQPIAYKPRTPNALKTYNTSIATLANSLQIRRFELKATDAATTTKDLQVIVSKLREAAGRIADSEIHWAIYAGLRQENRGKKTEPRRDMGWVSPAQVITREAQIVLLAQQRGEKIKKKEAKVRRNTAKKEAARMQMTIEGYFDIIEWYNNEKAKRPQQILRAALESHHRRIRKRFNNKTQIPDGRSQRWRPLQHPQPVEAAVAVEIIEVMDLSNLFLGHLVFMRLSLRQPEMA